MELVGPNLLNTYSISSLEIVFGTWPIHNVVQATVRQSGFGGGNTLLRLVSAVSADEESTTAEPDSFGDYDRRLDC